MTCEIAPFFNKTVEDWTGGYTVYAFWAAFCCFENWKSWLCLKQVWIIFLVNIKIFITSYTLISILLKFNFKRCCENSNYNTKYILQKLFISMAKKVFTLAPNIYFGKQLAKGGKN